MQAQKFQLQALRVGALPILNRFIARMGIEEELALALKNAGYADALLALLKNILVDRNALYAIGEWAELFDAGLVAQGKINDDKLARALDRLFAADRATLQTRIVLGVIKGFDLKMDQTTTTPLASWSAVPTMARMPRPSNSSADTANNTAPTSSSLFTAYA